MLGNRSQVNTLGTFGFSAALFITLVRANATARCAGCNGGPGYKFFVLCMYCYIVSDVDADNDCL